jgi:DnaD/phage-associated family protein
MNYKVNPDSLSAVFMVPSQIVDQHIKLAGGQQLKVLLWTLRHAGEGFDMEKMCRDLNFSVPDAQDFAPTKPEKKEEPATQKKELPDIVPSRPTAAEIAQRAEESADIKFLLLETQNKLGRTIGYDGQCTLLMMHDTYGIPVEVILMIIEYAVSIGKSSFHYIASIGKDWGEREIDTIEKADEQISRLNSVNRVWASFAAMAGLSNSRPTQTQTKYIVTWNREWGFSPEMIFLAYEQMAEHCQKMSFPYMNKVLESWHANGIKTSSDVEKANKPVSSPNLPQNKSKANVGHASSYDLNEFNRNAMQKPIVYKKKNKD